MPNTVPSVSPWPRRIRRSAASTVLIGVFVLSLFMTNSPAQAAKPVRPTPTPATCDLVPELRDVTVNQGVGAYTPLVRGKETLVRAYLAKPSCAASTAIIELTGGSLSVSAAGTTTPIGNPTPIPTAPYPQVASSTAAALADSTADPLFVVPGSALAPSGTLDRFTATFTITVRYRSLTSSGATPVEGQVVFTSRTGSTTPISATVEKRTNALRVLVVPMGDASRPFAETYTAAGDAALHAAMLTVSRIFPLPDGVGSLTGTTGGLRYSVSPGMLDLSGLVGADGRFCGSGGSSGNFNAIKASLGQFLQSWNAANGPNHQADRVLGVVDAVYSNGSSEGCAEGMAAISSTEAWTRVVPETTSAPSQSGLVAALELGHTFGLVPLDRDNFFSTYHSPNTYADSLRQNRSYNTRLRTILYEDLTAMTYVSAANNTNTLLEQVDWAYLICKLGGATTADCGTASAPIGTSTGVPAGPRFVISGISDTHPEGTEVLESFFSADMLLTPEVPGADFQLVFRDGGQVIRTLGVPATHEDSSHEHEDDGGESPHHDTGIYLFSGAFDFPTEADKIELWFGSPGTGRLLYERSRNGVPSLESLTVIGGGDGAQAYTDNSGIHDIEPAISADGRWVAWTAFPDSEGFSQGVLVAPIDDAAAATPLDYGEGPIESFEPAWCSDGTRLAYADDGGDIWIIGVDTGALPVTFGLPEILYDGDSFEGPPAGRHPTWSPDCSQLAFEAGGNIYRVDADGSNLLALTEDGISHDPSWSPDPGDNRIAFARDVEVDAFTGATLASFVEPNAEPIGTLDHAAAHLLVTTTADENDACDESCSLREAITVANATENVDGPDVIEFDIPGAGPHVISPASGLPPITDDVFIDGTSEPDYTGTPIVQVDGTLAGEAQVGLAIGSTTTGVTIRGLAITGFTADGIVVYGTNAAIEGSYIGVAPDGETAAGNVGRGVFASGANGLRIGVGPDGGAGNVISGNGWHGVSISGGSAETPVTGIVIAGNLIGTDATGTSGLGNATNGIFLGAFTQQAQVGGTTAATRNVISGNTFGVGIGGAGAMENIVEGNYIGTDVTGTADLGNTGGGIEISDSGHNRIGGLTAAGGNVISGNGTAVDGANGIRISGAAAFNNLVYNNRIGTDASGTVALGNSLHGIEITGDAARTIVGSVPQPNTIAHNSGAGIQVVSGSGHTFRGNVMYGNGGLGIDLGTAGVTPNDADDVDTGPNGLQNFPVITNAVHDGTSTTVEGVVDIASGAVITVDIYRNNACDGSGYGEGLTWIGQALATTDASGDAVFSRSGLPGSIGDVLTVVATDGVPDSSSEFSACATVTGLATPTFTVNTADDHDDGACTTLDCTLREAINRANAEAGTDTISFDIGDGGPQTILVTEVPLPTITEAVVIDGETQGGFGGDPLIRLEGGDEISTGLVVESTAGGSTIRGLLVTGFTGNGVEIAGANSTLERSWIGLDGSGDGAANGGNGVAVTADDVTIADNVISSNVGHGVFVVGAWYAAISGNHIGTNPDGSADRGNQGDGVHLTVADSATIGGQGADGNVISGNLGDGIEINNGGEGESLDHGIYGNVIGLNAAGDAALANGGHGVNLLGTGEVYIGTGWDDSSARNVISGNGGSGIYLASDDYAHEFFGNYIGTDVTGTAAIGNGESGILVYASRDASIGDGTIEGRNVISGNDVGITLENTDGSSWVFGNFIGTNAAGDAALSNGTGIVLDSAIDERIGGRSEGDGNVISGNTNDGILLTGNSQDNEIAGNAIGTDAGWTEDLGNGGAGVRIAGPSSDNIVGESVGEFTFGAPNAIAYNDGDGVELVATEGEGPIYAYHNSILSNSIWGNGGLGIDLEGDGVTPNDADDTDRGSNDLVNFPDNISAQSDGYATWGWVETFSAEPYADLIIQLYANDACDGSGHGEGQRLLDTLFVFSDATGAASDWFSFEEDLTGQQLTATISRVAEANLAPTSEFSECSVVTFDSGEPEREIHVLDADTGGTSAFLTDGDQPFWAGEGILYRLGGIRRIQPDGTGDEGITEGSDHASPTGGAGIIGFSSVGDSSDSEIYLITGTNTVIVSATDDVPEDLRLDLYYACGGQVMPIAVGLLPEQTGDETASFQYNFDASLSCAGGEILAALTDGFSRSTTPTGQGEPIQTEDKPPIASTYGPPLGSTYVTSDVIAFHGIGEDPEDGPLTGDQLEWFIAPAGDPCCDDPSVGSGEHVDFDAAQLTPGDYVVTLRVTDSDGNSDTADSPIHVLADSDNDGFSDAQEASTCLGSAAVTDGSTPSADTDSDGIPNGSDPDPCVRAPAEATATANFDPEEFSLTSNGTWITIYIETPGRNIREVAPGSVRIVEIAGRTVNFANEGISYKGSRMVAKFRRAALTDYFRANGLTSGDVPITVRGASTTLPLWSFEARDTTLVIP